MKYSILGCGWLGLPLAQYLIEKNNRVYGSTTTDKKLELLSDNNISAFLIKIDDHKIEGNIDGFLQSDTLIIDVPFGKQKDNFKGYQKLASAIESSSISKVIFISSTAVYADTNKVITEDALFIVNPLKQILVDLENLFLQHNGFETTIIRFSGLIGGSRNPGNFFKEGRVVKNGLAPINLIHLDDCIQIIYQISTSNLQSEVFNASADTHPSKKEFYTAASLILKNTPAEFLTNKEFRYKIISNQKLKQKLNYQFKYGDLLKLLNSEN